MRTILTTALIIAGAARLDAQAPDVSALMNRAGELITANNLDSGLVVCQQAIRAAPQNPNGHECTGSVLDLLGRHAEARTHLTKALELAPSEAKTGLMRTIAISYAFDAKASDAATYERRAYDAEVAAKRFDVAAGIANEMARIYLETGDTEHSLEWYRMGHDVAAKIPNFNDTAKTLWDFRWEHAQARIAARRGNAAEAQRHVFAAKALIDKGLIAGQARFVPYLSGYVAFYGGDYRTAIAQLAQADQTDPFILALLAQAYEKTGDSAKATEYWRAVMANPAHTLPVAFSRPLARKKVG